MGREYRTVNSEKKNFACSLYENISKITEHVAWVLVPIKLLVFNFLEITWSYYPFTESMCSLLFSFFKIDYLFIFHILNKMFCAVQLRNMASNRSQGGIQQLLAAEQEAQHIVNAARNGELLLQIE